MISAKRLEAITKDVTEWYVQNRQMLIKALEADGYPYWSVKLTPAEQYIKYRGMTEADWAQFTEALYDRFRGLPDASTLVAEEITKFRNRMQKMDRQFRGESQPFFLR